MAEPSRGLQISRRSWLLAGLGLSVFRARAADTLTVTYDGDNLHVSAPDLHFLSGKSLIRLKEGSTVVYSGVVRLFADAYVTMIRHNEVQFAVSYDVLSNDKFAVTLLGGSKRGASNLSAAATEAWCMENIFVTASGLAPDRQFWLQLDLGVINRKIPSVLGDSAINLIPLIDLLYRDPKANDVRWTPSAGPFRIADLARTPGRGRNG